MQQQKDRIGSYIRGTHPHMFRSGQWAIILDKVIVAPKPGNESSPERFAWLIQFPDGVTDHWPTNDPAAGYEYSEKLVTDNDTLPTSQLLMLEVLAARWRLGENFWTFRRDSASTKASVELEKRGLIAVLSGQVEKTFRARLTDAGRNEMSLDNEHVSKYVPPIFARIPKMMVHITHCCSRHGCKYGKDDLCPVANYLCPQKYRCEECDDDRV